MGKRYSMYMLILWMALYFMLVAIVVLIKVPTQIEPGKWNVQERGFAG